MNCREVQDLIITDYIDGQMEYEQKGIIDLHLLHCPACSKYLSKVRLTAVNPFNNASRDIPEKLLWERVKEAIDAQQNDLIQKSLRPDLWERMRSAVHIPRPAFALATLVTIIFMVGSSGQLFLTAPAVKINGQDQVEYMSSLIDEPLDMNNGNDPQTPIEKVFL